MLRAGSRSSTIRTSQNAPRASQPATPTAGPSARSTDSISSGADTSADASTATSGLLAEHALRADEQDDQQHEAHGDLLGSGELLDAAPGQPLHDADQDVADEGARQAGDAAEHSSGEPRDQRS